MTRSVITSASSSGGGGSTLSPVTQNWVTGTFGSGAIMTYAQAGSYTFTVPSSVTSIRVRCFGAGGGGSNNVAYNGGCGGGFAMGVKTVVGGTSYTVTVGAGGATATDGGTSSFGSLISATGGQGGSNNTAERTGGVGSGGDINYQGGGTQGNYSGGGGVASVLGQGGPGTYSNGRNYPQSYNNVSWRGGGAGGGMGTSTGNVQMVSVGANWYGPFGAIATGTIGNQTTNYAYEYTFVPAMIPQCVDMLGTGIGGIADQGRGNGLNGGGGSGGHTYAGNGGWPGGGGGAPATGGYGKGAHGCVIVEY